MTRTVLPQYFYQSKGTVLDDFQDLSSWTARGTAIEDTTYFKEGTKGIRVTNTVGSTGRLSKNLPASCMVGKKTIGFWFYIHDHSKTAGIRLYLFSSGTMNKYFEKNTINSYFTQGWNFMILRESDFINTTSAVWNEIDAIRLQFSAITGESTSVTWGGLYADPSFLPRVIISFDDASKTVYTKAYPIFKNAGVAGVFYLNSAVANINDNLYVTTAQLQEMYADGWDIANHTKNHVNLLEQTDTQIIDEVQGCSEWLDAQGFTRSAWHMSYPYGNTNTHIAELVESLGIITARTVRFERTFVSAPNVLFRLPIKLVLTNTTTVQAVESAIDDIFIYGGTLHFFGHSVADSPSNESTVATDVLQALIDCCVRRKVPIITISEWYRQMTNPRKTVSRVSVS